MKNILILFYFLLSSNFAYSNGEKSPSDYISEETLDDYLECAAFYVELGAIAKKAEKNLFSAYSSTQAEKALARALVPLSKDGDEADSLELLESKLGLKLDAIKSEPGPAIDHLRILTDKYFKFCEESLNDLEKPIHDVFEWADEGKCKVYIDGKESPYIPALAALYNKKNYDNNNIKQHIISAVNRGCDVNTTDQSGFSALNAGILFNEPDIVELMLDLGANPKLRIIRPGNSSGPNSFEFLEMLNSLNRPRKEIEQLLSQKHITNQ